MIDLIPLSLYIHIPWCIKKCPYCDFNSHAVKQPLNEKQYIDCLIEDFKFDYDGREIKSIFIGGGTPSLFSAESLAYLLNHLKKIALISDEIEITLEANPGTFEYQKFKDFRKAGINRLSIGVQSFQDQFLHALGRVHSADEADHAINQAKKAGFERINIDLMFALPEQTVEEAIFDIEKAISFHIEHISWYQLTIEPNTAFFVKPPKLPHEEIQSDIFVAGSEYIQKNGFLQYETSAWTSNQKSQHNLNYWQFGDYIGIGAGAHGKITKDNQIFRTVKFASPTAYLAKQGNLYNPYASQFKAVEKNELPFEFFMNGLRLKNGVEKTFFTQRTFIDELEIENKINQLVEKKLLLSSQKRYQTTEQGFMFLNDILTEFLPNA